MSNSAPAVPLDGIVDDRFAALRDAFAANLASGEELGGSICVLVDGAPVVDLWGGWSDAQRVTPWSRDTLTNVWSISKTVSSLAVLLLIDRGLVDPDQPVARYWPEFAAAGKDGVLVRHVLTHSSGVSGWEQPVTGDDILDVDAAADRLAAQAPWWPPGAASGYHLLDYGHLVHGIVRAVTGQSLGDFVAAELAGPLGADFWLGLPESEDARVSPVAPPPPSTLDIAALPPDSPAFRTLTGPPLGAEITWTRAWKAAGIGGAGGQGNARSAARLNSLIAGRGEVDGIRMLAPATVDRVFADPVEGVDLVLGIPLRWGLGWGLRHPGSTTYIPEGRIAFWGGWGGSLVTADVDRGVTFAYVMNRMSDGILASTRAVTYLQAAYAAL
ncbi:CubicO group peptidase (beta-lactamase class C family) [Microbacterium terrae]|uniref:Esterase EstB n=1 Tax=Microbacterium terrae TaxID=69369 RepID=A0A0M2HMX8_9MICO|nr:EstA family serine hydrolase [Microbacterium terrae]KJL45787.1 Esterase EstB [Microbacterium terrae]MBP1078141.1 CubicO group peptidase (beta-lactamase class C family) [Microbacterium terrae]GLJ97621.1 EstA family serine hydrolase [Microbacterium terrae]